MKVAVDKIGNAPLKINEAIPAASWEMDSFDVKFTDEIRLAGEVNRFEQEILVNLKVSVPREIICSRCLTKTQQTIEHDFQRSYQVSEMGEFLNVDDDIREEIMLNFPMRVLCSLDCKGLCKGCGANLNSEKCRCK